MSRKPRSTVQYDQYATWSAPALARAAPGAIETWRQGCQRILVLLFLNYAVLCVFSIFLNSRKLPSIARGFFFTSYKISYKFYINRRIHEILDEHLTTLAGCSRWWRRSVSPDALRTPCALGKAGTGMLHGIMM